MQLERYLLEGRLDIDDNAVESECSGDRLPQAARRASVASQNLIRPAKLGLKNYLFIGNAEAGPASALLNTLIANCREQKIDAERYFEEALRRMPVNATPEQAAELTPEKLAPLIRDLQLRPAYREKVNSVVKTTAALPRCRGVEQSTLTAVQRSLGIAIAAGPGTGSCGFDS